MPNEKDEELLQANRFSVLEDSEDDMASKCALLATGVSQGAASSTVCSTISRHRRLLFERTLWLWTPAARLACIPLFPITIVALSIYIRNTAGIQQKCSRGNKRQTPVRGACMKDPRVAAVASDAAYSLHCLWHPADATHLCRDLHLHMCCIVLHPMLHLPACIWQLLVSVTGIHRHHHASCNCLCWMCWCTCD